MSYAECGGYAECRCAECQYAECRYADDVTLSVIMLSVIILSVNMLSVIIPTTSWMSWRPFCVNEAQTASAKLETTPIQLVLASFIIFLETYQTQKRLFYLDQCYKTFWGRVSIFRLQKLVNLYISQGQTLVSTIQPGPNVMKLSMSVMYKFV
jgi:hypothetical protein